MLNNAGTDSDSENVTKILQLVESLPELHAIVLVVNGSNPRLTTDVVNTFNLLKGTLPDSVTSNTMAVLTMCNQLSRYQTLQEDRQWLTRPAYMTCSAEYVSWLTVLLRMIAHSMGTMRNTCAADCGLAMRLTKGHDVASKGTSLIDASGCSNLQLSTLPVAIKPEHVFFMQNSAFSTDPDR